MGRTLKVLAPAKVNLYLEVLGKRQDGYHEIETIMQEIELADSLDIEEIGQGIELTCNDPEIPCNEDNLVWKAARLLQEELGIRRGISIHLDKKTPVGAGLGGGSSDAASVLKGLNTLWNLGLGVDKLAEMGAKIGSDVPFFLYGGTALCKGRGEKVRPLNVKKVFHYTLLYPGVKISTRSVYENLKIDLTKDRKGVSLLLNVLGTEDSKSLGQLLFNRLEAVAFGLYPELQEMKTLLQSYRPCGVLLSGSGSCIYGLFETERTAEEAGRDLKRRGFDKVYVTRSLLEGKT